MKLKASPYPWLPLKRPVHASGSPIGTSERIEFSGSPVYLYYDEHGDLCSRRYDDDVPREVSKGPFR